jgi:predicted membrane protein (TIGR00267 family)
MSPFGRLAFLFRLSDSIHIARRYFVTNGFDGALTMLGLVTGFRLSDAVSLEAAFWACIGTAVALASSGISSAYISESAERRRSLRDLEDAMAGESLAGTAHGSAARLAPLVVALVNGGAPLSLALIITLPIWLGWHEVVLPLAPFDMAITVAFIEITLLGAFLGRIADTPWIWMSLKTLAVALVTAGIILLLGT